MVGHPAQQGLGGDVGSLKPPRVEDQAHANVLIFNGTPNNAIGVNGQYALRIDNTSANTRMYQKIGGVWTALVL